MDKYKEALEVLEPLSDRPWLWGLISKSHFEIACILLKKKDKKNAAEHLCEALKMLSDKRAPQNFISRNLLFLCILYLDGAIPEELIPEECEKKLEFYFYGNTSWAGHNLL
ncbi:hypothetical protein D6D85_12595 [Candidatus Methanodesulfokora washburnensis]|jgi:hypothetical protein|uniref:Tetratricopeptide repeat protein n=2 Tax=Candidatus Methanodesulfokora washburnensis TaxID=2478471 RepID=A0A3R9QBW0_9CREN|nr:hypothetical protein D6D85_12595 [Candidatus Methanodesulfokores washburnensis]